MPERDAHSPTRRELIRGALGASGALWAGSLPGALAADAARPNPIVEENRKEGALDWQLTRVKLDKTGGFRSPWIEGYCSHQSVQAGDTLQIMVSTTPAARFRIEVFRTGYYG